MKKIILSEIEENEQDSSGGWKV